MEKFLSHQGSKSCILYVNMWGKILIWDNLNIEITMIYWGCTCNRSDEIVDRLSFAPWHCMWNVFLCFLVLPEFGIHLGYAKSVADLSWRNWFGKHLSSVWNLRYRNHWTFDDVEILAWSLYVIKSFFQWSCCPGEGNYVVEFIDSFSFCL